MEVVVKKILAGVHRFMTEDVPQHKDFFEKAAARKQNPMALFITCSDSRVHPNRITDTDPGELFLLRNAGNMVPPFGASWGGEGATIEYALTVLGIRHIIVCGHSQCGAVSAMLSGGDFPDQPNIKAWLQNAEATRQIVRSKYPNLTGEALARVAAEENVLVQINQIATHPHVAALLGTGELNMYGWYYDIGSGQVREFDEETGKFEELGFEPRSVGMGRMPKAGAVNGRR